MTIKGSIFSNYLQALNDIVSFKIAAGCFAIPGIEQPESCS
jgi:hypothetical protein